MQTVWSPTRREVDSVDWAETLRGIAWGPAEPTDPSDAWQVVLGIGHVFLGAIHNLDPRKTITTTGSLVTGTAPFGLVWRHRFGGPTGPSSNVTMCL